MPPENDASNADPAAAAAAQAQADAAAAAVAAEAEAAATAAAAAEAAETPEAKAAKALDKRFSDVTRRAEADRRRAEEAERTAALALEALQRAAAPAPAKKADEDPKPLAPKFSEANDPDKFAEAMGVYTEKLTEWTARRAVQTHTAEREQASTREQEQREAQRIDQEYRQHRSKAIAELPDFEEIAENPALHVTPSMAAAMKATGAAAPRLLYHLGKHPDEAARIAKLSPPQQFLEIGALRASVATTPPVRKLPDPIKPQGAGRTSAPNPDEMSMDEYAASHWTKKGKGR